MSPFLQFGQKRHLSGTIAGETIKKIKLNHYAQSNLIYRICREFQKIEILWLNDNRKSFIKYLYSIAKFQE